MAFSVDFYQFNKEDNSTARPTGSPQSFNCVIKRGSGIINPTIELDLGLTIAPLWNYCYIPNFKRYYYVNEWYFNNALWSATLSCDVLATYRTEIGNTSLYALRSSAVYDGRIPDTLYPTKVDCTFNSSTITNPWQVPSNGCFVIGVVSKNPSYGSISYFALDNTAMGSLVQGLLDDTITQSNGFSPQAVQDISEGLMLSLVDPLQYIKSAVFIPVPLSSIDGIPIPLNIITVFNYPITISGSGKKVTGSFSAGGVPEVSINSTFSTIKHPQTNSRGNYVNTRPYTNVTMVYPPFGTIELDTTVLCDLDSFNVEVRIDVTSGLGILEVKAHGITLNRLETQIGVPVQLSQVTRDYLGAFNQTMSAGSSIANAVGSGMGGNVAGAVSSGFSAIANIGNAIASLVPRSQSIGGGGSYAQLYETPRVDFQFFELVDDDIAKNGRPCCQIVQCSNNAGYYLIQDGDVKIHGTKEEGAIIRSFLESGFFWE